MKKIKNKNYKQIKTINKTHNLNFYKKINMSIIRKSKIFIKSRFSRNRQSCRPIVYWSLYMNIAFIGFSQLQFYGFKFSLGYIPITLISMAFYFVLKRFISNKN